MKKKYILLLIIILLVGLFFLLAPKYSYFSGRNLSTEVVGEDGFRCYGVRVFEKCNSAGYSGYGTDFCEGKCLGILRVFYKAEVLGYDYPHVNILGLKLKF